MRHPATDINSKQIKILEYITNCLQNEYRCPTVREICEYIGLSSTSTVHSHLNALERFGYIKRDKNNLEFIGATGKTGVKEKVAERRACVLRRFRIR